MMLPPLAWVSGRTLPQFSCRFSGGCPVLGDSFCTPGRTWRNRWYKMRLPRHRLHDRRHHWLYRFECAGQAYTGGIGHFPDGRVSEVFINGSKVGTAAETSAQDAAIVASLALQHGCPMETIRHALARDGGGGPLVTLLNKVATDT